MSTEVQRGQTANERISAQPLEQRVLALIEAYREYGHLAADLDPLGLFPRDASNLELVRFGLHDVDPDMVIQLPGASRDADS